MKTLIANPIYDSVFKFLMEDERAAKVLLSALLKQEVRDLKMRRNEYTNLSQTRASRCSALISRHVLRTYPERNSWC